MNIAVGQGAMVATPLQMANAYGALANGGTLWKPRVVDRIVDASNRTLFVNVPSVNRQIDIDASTVANLRNDLNGVVAGPLGTARVAFEGFCSEDVDVCEAPQPDRREDGNRGRSGSLRPRTSRTFTRPGSSALPHSTIRSGWWPSSSTRAVLEGASPLPLRERSSNS